MTRLQKLLLRASAEFGILLELDFRLALSSGHELTALARFPDLGSPNGMLIVTSYDDVQFLTQELARAGFGFAVLDEPEDEETFDAEEFREMFADWGYESTT